MALTTSAKLLGFCLIFVKCTQIIHAGCPPVGEIPQCDCYDLSKLFSCNGLHSFGQLFLVASTLYGNEWEKLSFYNSKLRFWPSNIFSNIVIKEIFLNKCEILTFEEADFSQGLEGPFEELVAEETNLIENGEWKLNMRSLKTLTKLNIERIDVPELTQSLSYELPEGLKDLGFLDCEIQELEGGFFTPLKNLKYLNLNSNRITNLPKDINTLLLLGTLHLGGNNILQLPENMMISFPKLSNLDLEKNGIRILPKKPWNEIFITVSKVFLEDNPLICDDDMKWILEIGLEWQLSRAKCAKPERLRGKSLLNLKSEDFEQEADIARDEIDS